MHRPHQREWGQLGGRSVEQPFELALVVHPHSHVGIRTDELALGWHQLHVRDDRNHAGATGATEYVQQWFRCGDAESEPVSRLEPQCAQRSGDPRLALMRARRADDDHVADQYMTEPPLTLSVAPFTKLACLDARNTTTAATSSGSPIRRSGHACIDASMTAGGLSTCCIGVLI